MKIAVLGATGTIGRMITRDLESAGHTVVAASRSAGVDVLTGVGLEKAFTGVDVAVDCLNVETMSAKRAVRFFTDTATHVVRAAERAGVRRIVCVSIAGATDRRVNKRFGYYRGKAAQEDVYRAASVPVTIIHSTQWFELVPQIVRRASFGPLAVLPKMLMAGVAAERVAALVCSEIEAVAEGDRTVAIRGPEVATTAQLVRAMLAAKGDLDGIRPRLITEVPLFGSAISGGGLIPDDAIVDDVTLAAWLSATGG
ncbi:NAD(P)H-binding protein [Mycobacterium sp. M1]|uniref:NAD(P)H-binding protein n=1 Tax=Mycolicibacter acidiphilus TaxID=2835306 RepID=A0ABS5RGL1_9MYCO|nr:NAD(P)H-binding protein [Mycolicibacter acidiphilus]MBS9533309.1 NAD(P)H-binding protein [Mycolicibacter acidiphilus]